MARRPSRTKGRREGGAGQESWFHRLLSLWVIAGAVAIGVGLLAATCMLLMLTRSNEANPGIITALVTVIPPPSETPDLSTPTLTFTETLLSEGQMLPKGTSVKVEGTGGDGLRLRAQPALNAAVVYVAHEGDTLTVQDGPQQAEGHYWYLVVTPNSEPTSGWAVADFLTIMQGQ